MKRPVIRSIWRPCTGTPVINNRTLSIGRVLCLSDIPRDLRHVLPDDFVTVRVLDCEGVPRCTRIWNLTNCSPITAETYVRWMTLRLVAQARRWQPRFIHPDQRLSDIRFGVAKTINFAALVRRELGVTLSENALWRCATVGDLIDLVVRRALRRRSRKTTRFWRIVAALHAMESVREDVVAPVARKEAPRAR